MQLQHIADSDAIVVGLVYRFHRLTAVKRDGQRSVEDVQGWLYRVEEFVTDPIVRRDLVLYVGLEGTDVGRHFVCSLHDFRLRFRLEADAPPAEKVAG